MTLTISDDLSTYIYMYVIYITPNWLSNSFRMELVLLESSIPCNCICRFFFFFFRPHYGMDRTFSRVYINKIRKFSKSTVSVPFEGLIHVNVYVSE